MENKDLKKNFNSLTKRKIIIGCFTLLAAILVIAYLCISQYYKNHFYAKTFINGTDCSNMTVEEAQEQITSHVNTFVLTITGRNDVTEKISAADIGLTCTFDHDINTVLEQQSAYAWVANAWKNNEVDNPYTLSYDEDKLDEVIKNLAFLDSENQVEPTDATISEYSEETGFTVVAEDQGSKVTKKKLKKAITEAIENLQSELNLDESGCYKEPTVYSNDERITSAMETINKYMETKLTYTFGDNIEVFDSSNVGPALSVNEDYEVVIDENKVKDFVDSIRKSYDTIFRSRTFTTTYGETITLTQGDYGWWMNTDQEISEIVECIKNGEQKDKVPAYRQTAAQYGSNDYGDSYVEINLSAQHLFVYVDGEMVYESDFVSGSVVSGYETPEGIYGITYKTKDATLTGENYSTPVTYWMPFNGNVGMHDAYWRDTFGGDRFINNGSHGCINLPSEAAETIYGLVEKNTPVICYTLEGTESYDVAKYNKAKKN